MAISHDLQEIIEQSFFVVEDGTYIYVKVDKLPETDHFLVTKDRDETTVITTVERLDELDVLERNKEDYALICLEVSVPFYATGFLAAVSRAIATRGLNVLIVSTYSKDYILVKKLMLDTATTALRALGFKEKK